MKKTLYLLILVFICSSNLFGHGLERYKKLPDTSIKSKHLGFDKNISVTVPVEWQKNLDRTFPLIIIFDRQNQRSLNYCISTIDYLTSNAQMPSAIIVSIESEQKYRRLETTHKISNNNGLAEENEQFIFDELIPLMENEYRASSFRLLIGHSRYGYFTTALLTSRSDDLDGVIALSPFFTQKNIDLTDSIQFLDQKTFKSHKFYRFGIGNDFPKDFVKMDSVIKDFTNKKFDSKGYLFEEADHYATPGLTIGTALYEIFEDWSKIQSVYLSDEMDDLTIIDSLEEEITTNYGSKLEFALGVLNGKGWHFYNIKKYDKAIESWNLLLKAYPNYSEGYLYIIDAQIQLKQDISATIESFNKSLATSEFCSAEEKNELIKELENLKK